MLVQTRVEKAYEDALLSAAFYHLAEQEGERYIQESLNSGETPPAHLDVRIYKLIDSQVQKNRVKKLLNQSYRWASKVALWLILLLLVTVLAVSKVKPLRAWFNALLLKANSSYVEVHLADSVQHPERLKLLKKGSYYPRYIPDGFELTKFERLASDELFVFANSASANQTIMIDIASGNSGMNINNENLEMLETVDINGLDARYQMKEGCSTLLWSDGSFVFTILGDLSKEEIVKLAENLEWLE